jgi:succinate dehydrogenase flavin-adding protein (antitoxin of CptAB toxin-antitoxin module)
MRELDVVLERYLIGRYSSAPAAEQRAFEALLEMEDSDLYAMLLRPEISPYPELMDVLTRIAHPPA